MRYSAVEHLSNIYLNFHHAIFNENPRRTHFFKSSTGIRPYTLIFKGFCMLYLLLHLFYFTHNKLKLNYMNILIEASMFSTFLNLYKKLIIRTSISQTTKKEYFNNNTASKYLERKHIFRGLILFLAPK